MIFALYETPDPEQWNVPAFINEPAPFRSKRASKPAKKQRGKRKRNMLHVSRKARRRK